MDSRALLGKLLQSLNLSFPIDKSDANIILVSLLGWMVMLYEVMQVDFSTTYDLDWEAAPGKSSCLMYTGPGVDPIRHSTIKQGLTFLAKAHFLATRPQWFCLLLLLLKENTLCFLSLFLWHAVVTASFPHFPVPLCSRIKFSCFLSLSATAGDNYVVTLGEKSLSRSVIHKENLLSQMWNGPVVGTGHCGERVEMNCYCYSLPFHNTTFALILSRIYLHFVHSPCHFSA